MMRIELGEAIRKTTTLALRFAQCSQAASKITDQFAGMVKNGPGSLVPVTSACVMSLPIPIHIPTLPES
jgi:hypothetical protein